MRAFVTDTHGLLWYLEDDYRLGASVRRAFDDCNVADGSGSIMYVPTICLVEILYLQEKGRIPSHLLDLLIAELKDGAGGLRSMPLSNDVAIALSSIPRALVPDMPDRIIAASASVLNVPLITKDKRIMSSGVVSIW